MATMKEEKNMNIYVASSWRNAMQPAIVAALRRWGHEVYDFKNPAPNSIGSCWFAEFVLDKAFVRGLAPRIPFDGTPINPKTGKPDGYPKDLMLSIFGLGKTGLDQWRWK